MTVLESGLGEDSDDGTGEVSPEEGIDVGVAGDVGRRDERAERRKWLRARRSRSDAPPREEPLEDPVDEAQLDATLAALFALSTPAPQPVVEQAAAIEPVETPEPPPVVEEVAAVEPVEAPEPPPVVEEAAAIELVEAPEPPPVVEEAAVAELVETPEPAEEAGHEPTAETPAAVAGYESIIQDPTLAALFGPAAYWPEPQAAVEAVPVAELEPPEPLPVPPPVVERVEAPEPPPVLELVEAPEPEALAQPEPKAPGRRWWGRKHKEEPPAEVAETLTLDANVAAFFGLTDLQDPSDLGVGPTEEPEADPQPEPEVAPQPEAEAEPEVAPEPEAEVAPEPEAEIEESEAEIEESKAKRGRRRGKQVEPAVVEPVVEPEPLAEAAIDAAAPVPDAVPSTEGPIAAADDPAEVIDPQSDPEDLLPEDWAPAQPRTRRERKRAARAGAVPVVRAPARPPSRRRTAAKVIGVAGLISVCAAVPFLVPAVPSAISGWFPEGTQTPRVIDPVVDPATGGFSGPVGIEQPGGPLAGRQLVSAGNPIEVQVPRLHIDSAVIPISGQTGELLPPEDPQVLGWWKEGRGVGAESGSAVITGHTVHTGGGAFDHLGELVAGDRIRIRTQAGWISYVVHLSRNYSTATLARDAASIFKLDGPGRLVLITCSNFNGTTYLSNAVVYAVPVTDEPFVEAPTAKPTSSPTHAYVKPRIPYVPQSTPTRRTVPNSGPSARPTGIAGNTGPSDGVSPTEHPF